MSRDIGNLSGMDAVSIDARDGEDQARVVLAARGDDEAVEAGAPRSRTAKWRVKAGVCGAPSRSCTMRTPAPAVGRAGLAEGPCSTWSGEIADGLVAEAGNLFPVGDITEDSPTGSAAASLGASLRDRVGVPAPFGFTVRQGSHVGRPSVLQVEVSVVGGVVVRGGATL